MRDLRELYKLESFLCRTFETVRKFIANANSSAITSELISVRLERLEDAFKQFQLVRTEIELQTDPQVTGADDPEQQLALMNARTDEDASIAMEKENDFCNLKGELLRLLSLTSGSANVEQKSSSSLSAPLETTSSLARVKLPEIRLPTFDGAVNHWLTFRDSFHSLIHSSEHLTEMDKFSYLRSALMGEALQEVSSVEMTAANYNIAWAALNNRYENRKLIVKTYLDALFNVEEQPAETFDGLSRLINDFDKNIQMLEKVGEKSDGWSTLLVHMVCARLDPLTLRHWETHHNSREVPQFQELMCFLRNHCAILQTFSHHKPKASAIRDERPRFGVSHSSVQFPPKCPFCGDTFHSVFRCIKFLKLTVEERTELVMRARLCLICLSPGHLARVCSRGSCHHCGSRHHSLLHTDHTSSVSQIEENPDPSVRQAPQSPPPSPSSQPIPSTDQHSNPQTSTSFSATQMPNYITDFSRKLQHTNVHHTHSSTHHVLLSTAVVCVLDHAGNFQQARALLDSGSQFCFMTKNFSERLKLPSSYDNLTIQGIGGSKAISRVQVMASVFPRCSTISAFSSSMPFLVLPELTATLPACSVRKSWSTPKSLTLADPNFNKPGKIDLIIGTEFFFDLLCDGRFKVSDNGPSMQNSVFGWIISGRIPDKTNPRPLSSAYPVVATRLSTKRRKPVSPLVPPSIENKVLSGGRRQHATQRESTQQRSFIAVVETSTSYSFVSFAKRQTDNASLSRVPAPKPSGVTRSRSDGSDLSPHR
ncbi:uncharacterized protein LOC129742566 [Uranotaenia lowii]|uniref:uncharacterized protein LOC129742566 n=1 Tax=Uranotaenia lowii TaxID=190385 RepID=UPI00247AC750|nr:uncharacterized protein LOC129742566 [Uranotaenia lowii]